MVMHYIIRLNGEMAMTDRRVLVADDEAHYRDDLRAFLESEGCVVDTASNYLETRELLENRQYALVVCDKGMPTFASGRINHKCGLELLAYAKQDPRHKDMPFIIHTADDSSDLPALVTRLGGVYRHKESFPHIGLVIHQMLNKGARKRYEVPLPSGPYTIDELMSEHGRSECPRCHTPNGGAIPCPHCGGGS